MLKQLLAAVFLSFCAVSNIQADAQNTPDRHPTAVSDQSKEVIQKGAQPNAAPTYDHAIYPNAKLPNPGAEEPSEYWILLNHKLKITDTFLVIFTLGLFIATWLLFKATQRLVYGAEDTARRQLRAYLSVDPINDPGPSDKDKPKTFPLKIRNTGQTPAYRLWHWTGAAVFDYPLEKSLPPPLHNNDKIDSVLNPGGELLILKPFPTMTVDDLASIKSGKKALYLWGEANYVDAFARSHTTRFAYVATNESLALGRMRQYAEHNEAD